MQVQVGANGSFTIPLTNNDCPNAGTFYTLTIIAFGNDGTSTSTSINFSTQP